MKWEIDFIYQSLSKRPIDIPEGMEPFAVTRQDNYTACIWLRKKKAKAVSKKKVKKI